MAPEVGEHGLGENNIVLDRGPVRERQGQPVSGRLPVGTNEGERPVVETREQPPVVSDQVEAPVSGHAERLQQDLLRVVQEEALDGRCGDAGKARHGYSAAGGSSAWPQASAPPSTTTVVPVT